MATELHQADVDLEGLLRVLGENLYSTPEVALRELVQNAHDSCTRRRLEADDDGFEPVIHVAGNTAERTLTVRDNGAGLTDDEIRRYLATLGAGTTRLLRAQTGSDDLIGAFGLGFLSAYIVAERVEVVTTSVHTPEQTWRFSSRDGQRYTLEPAPTGEIGTTVVLHLQRRCEDLAVPARLQRLAARYCALLPIPVHAPVPVNAEPPPWRRDDLPAHPARRRPILADFAGRYETLFEPLCVLEVDPSDDLDAAGLIWVQDGATYGTSDHRHVSLFVRGMMITDDARKLLPEWAGFCGAVVQCDALTPTASREDVQRDAVWEALASHLADRLIAGLADVARTQPEAWRRVLRRHNEALLGAALADPRLFALLKDELTVPTTEGDLPMDEVIRRSDGRVVVSTGEESGPEEVLFRALSRPVVHGIRYGALPFAKRVAEQRGLDVLLLGTSGGDASVFPPATVDPEVHEALQALLGDDDTDVRPTRFQPASLPVVRVPDREVLLKRRLEDDETDQRIASGLLALARGFTAGIDDGASAHLYVNLDSPVVQRMLAADETRREHAAAILRALARLTGRADAETDLSTSLQQLGDALAALLGAHA